MILYHFFGRDRGYDIISSKKGYVQCLGGRTINESVVQQIKEDFLTRKGLDLAALKGLLIIPG
jgi:hypothetical protein